MKKIIYIFMLFCLTLTVVSCNKETKFENQATEDEIKELFEIFKEMAYKGYNYEYEYDTNDLQDNKNSRVQFVSNIKGKVKTNEHGSSEYDVSYTKEYEILYKNDNTKTTLKRTSTCIECFDDYDAFELLTIEQNSKGYKEKTTRKSIVNNVKNQYNYDDIFSGFNPLCNYINYFYKLISYDNSHLKKFIVFKEDNVYKCILSSVDFKEEYTIYMDKDTLDTVTKIEYIKKTTTGSTNAVLKIVSNLEIKQPKDYESYLD